MAAETFISQLEPGGRGRGDRAFAEAKRIAEQTGESEGLSFALVYRGVALIQQGSHLPAEAFLQRAEKLLETDVAGGAANLAWARMFLAPLTLAKGAIDEGADRVAQVVADGRARGDVALEVHAIVGTWYLPDLMLGSPDRTEAEVGRAMRLWNRSSDALDLMGFYELTCRTRVALYRGEGQRAYETLRAARRAIRRSGALNSGTNRALHRILLGSTALAAAQEATGAERRRLLREVARSVGSLGFFGDTGRIYSSALRMSAAAALGDPDAVHAAHSVALSALVVEDFPLLRAVIDAVVAHSGRDAAGVDVALTQLAGLGIREPAPWLRSWVPLLDLSA